MPTVRRRPSARLLVLDEQDRLLLFRFIHTEGALAGHDFWATPGGGLEPGESFADAAARELREETGWVAAVGEPVASREARFTMPDGEPVVGDERYFLVRVAAGAPVQDGCSALERRVMADHRWWAQQSLRTTADIVWPSNLPEMLAGCGAWR